MKEATGQEPIYGKNNIFHQIKRNRLKKSITNNLGYVIEIEDQLICFVEKENCRIEKSHSGYKIYHVDCIVPSSKEIETIKKYSLDKKIIYVLDGLTFNDDEFVQIKGVEDAEIKIRNCKFNFKLKIETSGNCSIINTLLNIKSKIMSNIKAKNILIDKTTINSSGFIDDYAPISINSRELLEIKNSNLIGENLKLYIESNLINIDNSNIKGIDVSIGGKNLQTKNSSIEASNRASLNIDEFNGLYIKAPLIKYKNEYLYLNGEKKTKYLTPIDKTLYNNRKLFLSKLRNIKDELEKQKKVMVEDFTRNIDNQSVGKMYIKIREKQL